MPYKKANKVISLGTKQNEDKKTHDTPINLFFFF